MTGGQFQIQMSWRALISCLIWPTIAHLALIVFDRTNEPSVLELVKTCCKRIFAALTVQVAANSVGVKLISYIAPISVGDLPMFVNAFSVGGSILSILVVRKIPRRPILLTSLVIIIVELAVMSYVLAKCGQFLKVSAISVFLFTVTTGFSSLPLLYTLEVFSHEFRAVGFSLVGLLNDVVQLFLVYGLNQVTKGATIQNTLWIACAVSGVILTLGWFLVEETKDQKESDPEMEPE
ncbi:hypothetical protein SO802_020202 [Lithocarpus litseifolius]|uniref:Uncharacterized protein n=1 Tax=Lithocarpus litseifolius TaxID=425828 RepID=A0AAW2CCG9_9ROSI